MRAAVAELHAALPFPLRGLDSDNGSEFINTHLFQYCRGRQIQFTRGRPYKKDDNAHVEQKNWTHVRKLLGWDRYDSLEAQAAINDLYRNELRLMMNLYQPSVKLVRKTRVGARLRRTYDRPQTPLDRLLASGVGYPPNSAHCSACAPDWTPLPWRQPSTANYSGSIGSPTAGTAPAPSRRPLS